MAGANPNETTQTTGTEADDAAAVSADVRAVGARAAAGMDRVVSRFATFFFDETRHRASLPLMASWLVSQARHREALSILDRYWRTGSDGVDDRLLEAAILRRLHGAQAALVAHRRAFDIDPNDAATQRGLLQGLVDAGQTREAEALARRLIERARDPAVIHAAIGVARPDWAAFGVVEAREGCCTGWCIWRGDDPRRTLDVHADGRSAGLTVTAMPHAYWTRQGIRFAPFRFDWPRGAAVVEVSDGEAGVLLRGAPLMNDEVLDLRPPAPQAAAEVAVIVPVYDDAKATRRCFDALLADGCRLRRRIIVVDDASPSAMIRAHLDKLAADGRIELIRNPHNVGFIRAVNRALRRVGDEDVVLLNADTHVPRGWLERLREVACRPGVGTVTPLSNNGELVSLPGGFRSNAMPTPERIEAIDAAARRLGGEPVHLPNGVGFCLYVRNAALRAVGGLDAGRYERGYLEEVDFCLRVARAGFANVCAPTVYVGHQGEASFGASKRSLVTANAVALMRRWPDIEAQTTAFVTTDPLRATRAALAFVTLDPSRQRRLAICAGPAPDPAALRRLREEAAAAGTARELATLSGPSADPRGWRLRLPGMDHAVALPPDVASMAPEPALERTAALLGAADAVLLHGRDLDPGWWPLAPAAGLPVDLMPVDASPWPSGPVAPRRVLAASEGVASQAREAGVAPVQRLVDVPRPRRPVGLDPDAAGAFGPIGIVPADASPGTFAFIRDLARALLRRGSPRQLIVLGTTLRDVGIMRLGNAFVTGPLDDDAPETVLSVHRCAGLLLTQRDDRTVSAALDFVRASGLPFAAFPCGGAADLLREGGLSLDPGAGPDDIAAAVDLILSPQGLGLLGTARTAQETL